MLIIGSRALQYYAQERGVPFRSPGDTDVICTRNEMLSFCSARKLALKHVRIGHYLTQTAPGRHMEFEITEDGIATSGHYYQSVTGDRNGLLQIAPLDVLFSIKKSHRFIPKQWKKHIQDYHLMKSWGLEDMYPAATALRRKEYENFKTPSLNKTADEFFDDHVSNHTFVHDDIHAIMAYREKPMFEYIKVDTNLVKCSKEKFYALNPMFRIFCVLEEAYVIALERAVIPMLYEGKKLADSESALDWALFRICTTLTSGWFREYAVENYPAISAARDPFYARNFLSAVESGKIRRIEECAASSTSGSGI